MNFQLSSTNKPIIDNDILEIINVMSKSGLSPKRYEKFDRILKELIDEKEKDAISFEKINGCVSKLEKTATKEKINELANKVNALKQDFAKSFLLKYINIDPAQLSPEEIRLIQQTMAAFPQSEVLTASGAKLIHFCANSSYEFYRSLVPLCLANGADPNAPFREYTPLSLAFHSEDVPNIHLLFFHPLTNDETKSSLLNLGLQEQKLPLLLTLIEKGANLRMPQWLVLFDSIKNRDVGIKIKDRTKEELKQHLLHHLSRDHDLNINIQNASGKTILDLAMESKDQESAKILLLRGAKLTEMTPRAKKMVDDLYKKYPTDPESLQLFKALFVQFPPSLTVVSEILQEGHPEVREFLKMKLTLEQIEKLSSCLKGLTTLDLPQAKKKLAAANAIVHEWENLLGDVSSLLKSELEAWQQRLSFREKNVQEWFQKNKSEMSFKFVKSSPILLISEVEKSSSILLDDEENLDKDPLEQDLIAVCIQNKNYAEIPSILSFFRPAFTKHVAIDKPVFHFILDKCMPLIAETPSSYHSGMLEDHAFFLLEALHNSLKEEQMSSLTLQDRTHIKKIMGEVSQSLGLLLESQKSGFSAKTIYDIFCGPPLSFPLLLRTGCETHATLVSLQKNDRGTVTLTLYNSGGGLENHPEFKGNQRLIQTFLSYEEIPAEQVTEKFIEQMLSTIKEQEIEPLYDLFKKMGSQGKLVPPSSIKQDYEQEQMQGTCTAQCLMSFLRHYINSHTEGSAWHKLGLYKMLKARTIQQIGLTRLQDIDHELLKVTKDRLQEQAQELDLAKMAAEEDKWAICQESLYSALRVLGQHEFIATLQSCPSKTTWERFTLLRTAIRHLSYQISSTDQISKFFEKEGDLSNILSIIQFLMIEKQAANKHLISLMNSLNEINKTRLLRVLATVITSPKHSMTAYNWLESKIAENPEYLHTLPEQFRRNIILKYFEELASKVVRSVD